MKKEEKNSFLGSSKFNMGSTLTRDVNESNA